MNIRHILIMTLAACALHVQAQQKVAVKAPRQAVTQSRVSSARAQGLSDNQRLLGYIITDSITVSGGAFGAEGTYSIGAVLTSKILSGYEGCRVVGVRLASAVNMGRTRAFVCSVTGNSVSPILEQKQRIYEGWNNVFFNGDGYEIKGDEDLFFGFDYVETEEMVKAEQGGICGFGEDSDDGFYAYGDFGQGTGLYSLSNVGRLCVQLIVDVSALPLYDVDFTWFDTGFKYKVPGEQIDGLANFANVGRANIHKVELGYQLDNEAPVYSVITDSIRSGEIKDWKFLPTLPSDIAIGMHTLKIFASKVEGEPLPEKSKNDTLMASFAVYRDYTSRNKVFMEIYTDQSSVYSALLDDVVKIVTDATDDVAVVNVHKQGTTLAVNDALYLHSLYAYTLPSFTVNRSYFPGENYIAYDMNDYLPVMSAQFNAGILEPLLMQDFTSPTFATLQLEPTYDAATRKLTIKATGDVLPEAKAIYQNLALTLMVTEDQVKARQTVYNSLTGRTTNNSNYLHDHVLRAYITSPIGDAVDCPADRFEANYEYTLDSNWNADNIKVIGLLTKKVDAVTDANLLDMDIINANSISLGVLNGIEEIEAAKCKKANTLFNLNGQKVNKAKKGLYIINGKKVIIK